MASTSTAGYEPENEFTNVFEGIAPSPSTSRTGYEPENELILNALEGIAPSPYRKLQFDVFINHFGPDVKHTLATTLYNTLKQIGLRVFLDSEELEVGDLIPTAIQDAILSAQLHIAIFSKGYAKSPWCLGELSFMVKTGTTIIPVFYHVHPGDLRWVLKGVYADAFSQHEMKGRYSSETIQEWKNALYTVSCNSGQIIDNNDNVPMLLKKIGNHVLNIVPLVNKTAPSPFASSSSSTLVTKLPFDVFINHCGRDVKNTLATTLYNTLDPIGLRVFLDSEELKPGDYLPETTDDAMRSASLHIAIFSERYAESPWCLAELSAMLKTGIPLVPVFYHVQPTDLRWVAKGVYASAFSQHEKNGRYTREKLEEWKRALHEVSCYRGLIIDNNNNDDERMLLKNLVNYALGKKKKVPLEVAKHPVGLDEAVEDFEMTMLQSAQRNHNVQIVGICAQGGSGKTTLAKELYNQRCSSMERSSILFDVRDAASKGVLHNKQLKLLEDLGVKGVSFDNIEEGKGILARCLKYVRLLLVLDDVDNVDQLDALLPAKESLGSGSLIIITTRELGVLTSWGVSSIYKMRPLNPYHAEQLFCWHAFLRPFPLIGFEELVKKFLNVCGGLPVSLEVLGSQLCGSSKDYWESLSHKLSRILPRDVKQRLKISYDALDHEEKDSFLDTACFFIGEEKSLAIAVWDGCGLSGVYIWERLISMYLVELDEWNRIRMHDQLRDLGRDIASQQSPHRLWSPSQIFLVQNQAKDGMAVRGICGMDRKMSRQILVDMFVGTSMRGIKQPRSSPGLKILHVYSNQLTEELASLSEDLLWLRWYNFCEQRNLPSWLLLSNLRVLELLEAYKLEKMWEDNVNLPLQLRELRITQCHNVQRFPSSIGRLKHLKKIILEFGFRGNCLPEEFCGLKSLEHLELPCAMLSSLPDFFGNLTNLRHLDLYCCKQLTMLPISFKQLRHLEYLRLSCCTELKLRSDVLENINKLEYLDLTKCYQLEELPRHINNELSLRRLYVDGTSLRDVPTNIGRLCKLEELRIGSPLLRSLPTSLGNLCCLKSLIIDGCPRLECLPLSIGRLNLLREVRIRVSRLRELPFGVRQWCLSYFRSASTTSISEECYPKIETLRLFSNPNLMEIRILPTSVNILEICVCNVLKNIRGTGYLVKLQKLQIYSCPELDELPSFANLVSMKEFDMQGCPKVDKIEGLEYCTSLQSLTANTCWDVPGIESLENVEGLRRVDLTCDTISALKPCIQSIKVCPREMMIRGRVVRFVKPIVESLALPNLTVLQLEKASDWDNISPHSLNEAFLWYEEEKESNNEQPQRETPLGKLVHIAVSTKGASALREYCAGRRFNSNLNVEEWKGMLAIGEEPTVVEAFHQLFSQLE